MIASTLGADLIMYGPIENVEAMITAQAYTDIVVMEAARDLGIEPKAECHPFFKLV
jgi:tetrahydromethanopterin S-methyltransferase subunit H